MSAARRNPRGGRGVETVMPTRAARTSIVAFALLAACDGAVGPLAERLAPETAHEAYAEGLRDADLAATALGGGWLRAADSALLAPVAVSLPFRESGWFSPDEARAVAYRVELRAGQRLVAELRAGDSTAVLFADLYEVPEDTLAPLDRIASADSTTDSLTVTARRDRAYVLRVQPELLRGVRYDLVLRAAPSLAVFPVAGRGPGSVRSFFGAERDGGARAHHGIDIFAPRGTPVVAATDGFVRSTTPSRLGGKLVWLRDDEYRQSLYYAHLDTVLVVPGQQVRAGDTLGLVGNTGNARTTPPHLHFGIYSRGPKDPLPYVREPRERPTEVTAALAALGERRRTGARVALRARPDADDGETLAVGTPLRVIGAAGASYRVVLPDGRAGWVRARSTEPLADPLGSTRLAAGAALRDGPTAAAATIETVAAPRSVSVLARFGSYALVRDGRRTGWVEADTD